MGARWLFTALVGLTTAMGALTACASDARGPVPDDLLVRYEWREGSLPPPYHYEYSIRLQSDGAGEVTMVPDYAGDEVPVWSEPFSVSREQVAQLYGVIVDRGLFSQTWRELEDPPVGGSSEMMSVVANGRIVTIPAFLPPDQRERAEDLYAALRSLVPTAVFAGLEARRAAYVAEHESR